jgi:hypothetical protein
MGAHIPCAIRVAAMKTTIEISDSLLAQARKCAQREGVTLRALVERGLHHVVGEQSAATAPFKLRPAAFDGEGLQPEAQDASWAKVREAIYADRGG